MQKLQLLLLATLFITSEAKKHKHLKKHSKAVGEVHDQYQFHKITQFKGDPVPLATQYYSPTSTQVVTPYFSIQSTFIPEKPAEGASKDLNYSMVSPYVYAGPKYYQMLNNPYSQAGKSYYSSPATKRR